MARQAVRRSGGLEAPSLEVPASVSARLGKLARERGSTASAVLGLLRDGLARGVLLAGALLAGCEERAVQPAVADSASLSTAAERVTHLCDVTLCPTRPLDAAFLANGDGEGSLVAAVKVRPDDVAQWRRGCASARFDARPKWLLPLLAQRGWTVTTAPDSWRCGPEERLLHVKESVVVRRVKPGR